MATILSVTRGTANINTDKRVIDMRDKIDVLEPDASPLKVLTKKLASRVAINPKYNWLEDEGAPMADAINYSTGYTTTDTQVVVDHGSYFAAGDVLKVPGTGEQLRVTDVSTNTLTISRGWGSTSAGNLANNAELVVIGNANEEGTTKRTLKSVQEVTKTNYTQIFRLPFGVTETNKNSEMYGGQDLAHVRMMKGIDHQKQIELGFWFGEPKEDTDTGTHPIRATGGVDYWISTNVTADANGTITEAEFDTWLRSGFRYGSKVKFVFAAPLIMSAITSWAKSKLQLLPKDETYGLTIVRYQHALGAVNLVNVPLFSDFSTYSGYAYLLDMESLGYRYLSNRDTKLKTNIQDPSADSEEDEYLTECGLELRHERKHSVLTGVTTY